MLFMKLSRVLAPRNHSIRCWSTKVSQVSVYISKSHDPFANLAFEDWVYSNIDLSNRRLLFIWRNIPTVVIGRHQNPWVECNIKKLQQDDIKLARRKSGGGCVYHDLGNLNATFFTHRSAYNRKENLALIVKALRERWQLDVNNSPRDDILLDNDFKISGTSSKLGRASTYHHCTLLLNVNTHALKDALTPSYNGIASKATDSKRAKVKNLCSIEPSLDFLNVSNAIAQTYLEKYSPQYADNQILFIDPECEENFPGITDLAKELQKWQWTYGKTPRFCVPFSTNLSSGEAIVVFYSYHGKIEDVRVSSVCAQTQAMLEKLVSVLKGCRFWPKDIIDRLQELTVTKKIPSNQNFAKELIHWMQSAL